MPGVRLELLGGFQLYSADREPIILTARKSRGLLAYLALDMRRAHARDRLAALLWPDSGEMQARTSLRQALTAVRRALGEGADALIAADVETVALAPDAVHAGRDRVRAWHRAGHSRRAAGVAGAVSRRPARRGQRRIGQLRAVACRGA